MITDTTSSLIQDWYVLNDDRWANLLVTSRVRAPRPVDAGILAAAA
jgi:hypothetical protein